MRLRKAAAQLVERERVCRVATVDARGRPHVVPVCHVWRNGRLYFAADAASRKVRHLEAHPQVAVVVDVYVEDWGRLAGVLLQGTARLVRGGPVFRKVRAQLYRKYPQYPDIAAIEPPDTVIVEVTPAHAASWGLD